MTAATLRDKLLTLTDPVQAAHYQRFFRTGSGEYGAGDVFLELTSPQVRTVSKAGRSLP